MNNSINRYYTLRHVALISGLTDRTLRSHINAGYLQGEKINGLWHFTPEQVEDFLRHPSVRPGITAKNNALVHDFLADCRKTKAETCVLLDLPNENPKEIAEYFCYRINQGNYQQLNFCFDSISGTPRIILKGRPEDVFALITAFYRR